MSTMSCDTCLYNKLCKGEGVCADYEPSDMYAKFTWKPGDVGYILFACQVHKVKVNWVAYHIASYSRYETVFYNFYGEELTYRVGDPKSNKIYRSYEDAAHDLIELLDDKTPVQE